MGFSNFFGSGFEPNYCVYKENGKLNIKFEASGKISQICIDYEYIDGDLSFTLSRNKEIKLSYEDGKTYFYRNTTKECNFSFNIKLPT